MLHRAGEEYAAAFSTQGQRDPTLQLSDWGCAGIRTGDRHTQADQGESVCLDHRSKLVENNIPTHVPVCESRTLDYRVNANIPIM